MFGSQAILGQYPDAPEALRQSVEADMMPKNRPERADDIDGALGEFSMFHQTFGFTCTACRWRLRSCPTDGRTVSSGFRTRTLASAPDGALKGTTWLRASSSRFVRRIATSCGCCSQRISSTSIRSSRASDLLAFIRLTRSACQPGSRQRARNLGDERAPRARWARCGSINGLEERAAQPDRLTGLAVTVSFARQANASWHAWTNRGELV